MQKSELVKGVVVTRRKLEPLKPRDVKRTNYLLRSRILSLYFILLPKKRSVNGRKLVSIIENYSKNRMEELFEFS
jgi:hypothetical protein